MKFSKLSEIKQSILRKNNSLNELDFSENEIYNISVKITQAIYGGEGSVDCGNDACNNNGCSDGFNSNCTNSNCNGTIQNTNCTNEACR